MAATLLQIDFPYGGPWGEEMAAASRELAEDIARTPGLRWKIWTENAATGRAGGIYLFDDLAAANSYLSMHTERLARFGIAVLRAEVFEVNEALTQIDRGPIG